MTVACNATAVSDANRQGVYTIDVAGKLLGSGASLPSTITSVEGCSVGATRSGDATYGAAGTVLVD